MKPRICAAEGALIEPQPGLVATASPFVLKGVKGTPFNEGA
jgi:hypothetical protein